jgi:hypothetical protein
LLTSLPTNNRLVWRSIRFFGSRIDKIADPALRKQVARNALHVTAKLVFEDGFLRRALGDRVLADKGYPSKANRTWLREGEPGLAARAGIALVG